MQVTERVYVHSTWIMKFFVWAFCELIPWCQLDLLAEFFSRPSPEHNGGLPWCELSDG
jgi:hypothetical protein